LYIFLIDVPKVDLSLLQLALNLGKLPGFGPLNRRPDLLELVGILGHGIHNLTNHDLVSLELHLLLGLLE
jgi:hypothetical protein